MKYDRTNAQMQQLRLARSEKRMPAERRRQQSLLPVLRQAGMAVVLGETGMTVRKRITIDSESQLARILALVDGDPLMLPGAKRVYRKDLHEIVTRVPGEVLVGRIREKMIHE